MQLNQFFRALTLEERGPDGEVIPGVFESWFEGLKLDQARLDEYLKSIGCSQDELVAKLTSTNLSKDITTEPIWLTEINDVISCVGDKIDELGDVRYSGASVSTLPFPDFFNPILACINNKLTNTLPNWHDYSTTVLQDAQNSLLNICFLTLYDHYKQSGISYPGYSRRFLLERNYEEFLQEFPVLARLVGNFMSRFVLYVEEIVVNLSEDLDELVVAGLVDPSDKLISISTGLGDVHNGGRSVAKIGLGNHFLYYRPRVASEFTLYNSLISAAELDLPPVRFLNGNAHCWVAEVHYCSLEQTQLDRYLWQLGVLSSVLTACGAKDMHYENIVASAEGPVAVDLETLVAPLHKMGPDSAISEARDYLNDSPLGTGIFPIAASLGVDDQLEASAVLGGLTTSYVQIDQIEVTSDDVLISKRSVQRGFSKSMPLGSSIERIGGNIDSLLEGLRYGVQRILGSSDRFDAVFANAGDMRCRVILRPTNIYDVCVRSLRHPAYMRSMLARERFLLRFWQVPDDDSALDPRVVQSEVQQLLAEDIPYFDAPIEAMDVYHDGVAVMALSESASARRIRAKNSLIIGEQRNRQVLLVSEAIKAGCKLPRIHNGVVTAPTDLRDSSLVFDWDATEKIVDKIYQKFLDTAFISNNEATWIGFSSSKDSSSLRLAPLGDTLYDGISGVGLAMAAFFDVTGELSSKALAEHCFQRLECTLTRHVAGSNTPIGAYSGLSGMIYGAARGLKLVGHELSESFIGREETRLCDMLLAGSRSDKYLDISSGTAGAISVITSLYLDGIWTKGSTLDTIWEMCQILLDKSTRDNKTSGLAWEFGEAGIKLGGLSHGSTGMALALAYGGSVLGDEHLAQAAVEAFRSDDNYFDSKTRLWRDMRSEVEGDSKNMFPNHWCHGASGILLARTKAAALIDSDEIKRLASTAGEHVWNAPLPSNLSLCHGILGNALCVRPFDYSLYRTVLYKGMNLLFEGRLVPGIEMDINEVPGLMIGHSGILYALCSSLKPSLPNVLALE